MTDQIENFDEGVLNHQIITIAEFYYICGIQKP